MADDEGGTGADLWNSLLDDRYIHQFNLFLFYPSQLYHDAARAFDAGAYSGTTLLCRAVLEAAFYTFLTREVDAGGKAVVHLPPPRKLTGELRRVAFHEIWEAMRKVSVKFGILSDELMDAVKRIQMRGNVQAHIATHEDKQMLLSDSAEGTSPGPALEAGKEETWRDLRATGAILRRLADVAVNSPEWTGPAARRHAQQ